MKSDPITRIERALRKRVFQAIWRRRNAEKLNAYSKQYAADHPDQVRATKREWARRQAQKRREAKHVSLGEETAAGGADLAGEESRETQGATSTVSGEVSGTAARGDAGVAEDAPQESQTISGTCPSRTAEES